MSKQSAIHPTSGYTRAEEIANTVTHGLGLILGVAALVLTVVFASLNQDAYLIVASAIYGTSLVLLYTASTLYHAARNLRWKKRFLILDHACIYLLIAGTYTPFVLGPLRGPSGWSLFGVIWSLALFGIIREVFIARRGGLISSLIYLAMGWAVVAYIIPLYVSIPRLAFVMLISGGVVYSLGVVVYLMKRLPYHHAIWHLFVVGGSVCQCFAILSIVMA
jgi:hemolysin III|tara:strand:- start:9132 stop:9791 length:660 start_codon:yes stop_codon:yes gene_type:complete